jgi:hypothetical protein
LLLGVFLRCDKKMCFIYLAERAIAALGFIFNARAFGRYSDGPNAGASKAAEHVADK